MTAEEIELLQELKNYMSIRSEIIGYVGNNDAPVPIGNFEMDFEQRIDAVLRSAIAQTKAEVYNVMFDTTTNAES